MTIAGLSTSDATARLQASGPNVASVQSPEPWWAELVEEIREPMILLLLVTAAAYFALGEIQDALVVLGATAAILGVEMVSEARAKGAVKALRALANPYASVLRDGEVREIDARDVVPDDVIVLRPGGRVPADLRLVEAAGLRIDESIVTGESASVLKSAPWLPTADDPRTLALAGTLVIGGKGRGIVVATGPASTLGQIASLVASVREPRTPLQVEMRQLAATLAKIAIGVSVVVPVLAVAFSGTSVQDAILSGLTFAFATIPEELPILITMVLALGGLRLSHRGAIAKRLVAAETLGSVTVICTDKTGTLTRNRMTLAQAWLIGRDAETAELGSLDVGRRMLRAVVMASDAPASVAEGQAVADPTEIALLEAAARNSVDPDAIRGSLEVVDEWPFDEDRKRLAVLAKDAGGRQWLFAKGAVETVLPICARIAGRDGDRALTASDRSAALAAAAMLASRGMRVLAVADRQDATTEADAVLLGLVALADPPRPEVRAAIAEVQGAGIRVIVLTGDHVGTARAVAAEVGLDRGCALEGRDIDALSDAELLDALRTTSVVARIVPEQKLRIVRVLSEAGEVVAVTGDGVNDAPALKRAAVGVAMGRSGSDVAREAADLVLTNDDFSTLDLAVREGRRLYANLGKAVSYYLATKVAMALTALAAIAFRAPLPFAPIQLITIELFLDAFAAITFTIEPADGNVMRDPPRGTSGRLATRGFFISLATAGLTLAGPVSASYLVAWTATESAEVSRSAAFFTWMVGHVLLALVMRRGASAFWRSAVRNPAYLVWAASALVLAVASQRPTVVADILHTAPLPAELLRFAIAIGCVPLVLSLRTLAPGRARRSVVRPNALMDL